MNCPKLFECVADLELIALNSVIFTVTEKVWRHKSNSWDVYDLESKVWGGNGWNKTTKVQSWGKWNKKTHRLPYSFYSIFVVWFCMILLFLLVIVNSQQLIFCKSSYLRHLILYKLLLLSHFIWFFKGIFLIFYSCHFIGVILLTSFYAVWMRRVIVMNNRLFAE